MVGLIGCGCCNGGGGGGGSTCSNGYVEEFNYSFSSDPLTPVFRSNIPLPPATSGNWSYTGGRLVSWATTSQYMSNRAVRCQFQTYPIGDPAPYQAIEFAVDYEVDPLPGTAPCYQQVQLHITEELKIGALPIFIQLDFARYSAGGPVEAIAFFKGNSSAAIIANPPLSGSLRIRVEQSALASLQWNATGYLNGTLFPGTGIQIRPANNLGGGVSCDHWVAVTHASAYFAPAAGLATNLRAYFDNLSQDFTPQ
jgi:hypothetical protein